MQQALAWLQDRHGPPGLGPVDPIHPHPIAHANGLATFAQAGSPGAQQALHPCGTGLIQGHPTKVGHHGHHQARQGLNRHGRGLHDL